MNWENKKRKNSLWNKSTREVDMENYEMYF